MMTENEASRMVYLHDVPIYTQGSMDMACGYYCALMFLTAMSEQFGKEYWGAGGAPEPLPFKPELFGPSGVGITVRRYKKSPGLFPIVNDVLSKYGLEQATSPGKSSVWAGVVEAIRDERPSILRLPDSAHHPGGHYVVVKGYVPRTGARKESLLVNDPSTGEREIREAAVATDSKPPASALIARHRTWLRCQRSGKNEGRDL